MKRAVYDKIGGLDERFGLGFFDDDDLAERARRAGFELAVAHDLFVHHFGSRTFVGNGIDAGKILDENAGRFAAKWGAETNGRRVSLQPWTTDSEPQADGTGAIIFTRRRESHAKPQRRKECKRACVALERRSAIRSSKRRSSSGMGCFRAGFQSSLAPCGFA